ncbi:MAG TPA: thiol-disulfide oxidoreductase ResA [Candidatus Dormibacteraeota bacterium]|nr:thiol-disulfide oxidoreductase ResA [Candidatus Dormibacteraeota bacterium]
MALNQAHQNKQQKMKKRFIFRTITLTMILFAIIFALVMNLTRDKAVISKGDQAPDFELFQINSNNEQDYIRLSHLQGKGVVLQFGATYCQPCEGQLLITEALYSDYKDEIEMVSINVDNSELVIQQFIDKYHLSLPVLHDARSEIIDLYGVSPIPHTFFISPEGKVVDEIVGALTFNELNDHFKEIRPKSASEGFK